MRTTVAISTEIAQRVADHSNEVGNRSMTASVEFMLRKACDYIEAYGYDALIKIPAAKK